jgi:hypothetical protein
MKKLLIFLFSLSCVNAFSQKVIYIGNSTTGKTVTVLNTSRSGNVITAPYTAGDTSTEIGYIFNTQLTNSALSIRTGSSGTWSYFNNSWLNISGTGTNAPDNYIEDLGWITDLEKNTRDVFFTPTVDGYGIGIGMIATISGSHYGWFGRIVLTGATKGQLRFEGISADAPVSVSNSGTTYFTVTNGQEHKLSLTRTPDTLTLTITNTVTSATQSLKYAAPYVSGTFQGHRANHLCIFWYGGSQTITGRRYYSPILRNCKLLFAGDSWSEGAYAGSNANRYFAKLQAVVRDRLEIDAGASNTSADIILLLPEILLLKPHRVLVSIGSNAPFTQANVDTIRNVLTRNNIPLYFTTVIPRASGKQNTQNAIIRAETGITLIDYDSTLCNGTSALYSGYNSGDGVHPNAAGNNAVYTQLLVELANYLDFL